MATIVVLGTFDTKGREHAFVAERIRELGHEPLLVDGGGFDAPAIPADVTREQVAAEGGLDLAGSTPKAGSRESSPWGDPGAPRSAPPRCAPCRSASRR